MAREKDRLIPREQIPTRFLNVINTAFGGEHHVDRVRHWGFRGIAFNVTGGLATFDMGRLTALVIACHDNCVRGEVDPAGPYGLRVTLFERARAGGFSERHPTIEEAITLARRAGRPIYEDPPAIERGELIVKEAE